MGERGEGEREGEKKRGWGGREKGGSAREGEGSTCSNTLSKIGQFGSPCDVSVFFSLYYCVLERGSPAVERWTRERESPGSFGIFRSSNDAPVHSAV